MTEYMELKISLYYDRLYVQYRWNILQHMTMPI